MQHYKLIAMTNAAAGRDAEYNDWYNNVHLRDALAVDGVVGAQRFQVLDGERWNYFTLYDLECNDPAAVLAELSRRAGTDVMFISDSLDRESVFALVGKPIGTHRSATTGTDSASQ
jgi:hypothetical protein